MDEILIEEKKYISSKRAAKVTGYAKDYIGQLCREGRVSARLVGRNWYVLESAIQDHRFGQQEIEPEFRVSAPSEHVEEVQSSVPEPLATWESPRYEASSIEALPTLHTDANEQGEGPQHLQDSWKEWFERVADTAPAIADVILEKPEEKEEEIEVNIPIRAIHHSQYQPPPEELLPNALAQEAPYHRTETKHVDEHEEGIPKQEANRIGTKMIAAIQVVGVSFAVLAASLAIIGSGYLDKYILSSNRASLISGVVFYNR
jgi:hypothetical protein